MAVRGPVGKCEGGGHGGGRDRLPWRAHVRHRRRGAIAAGEAKRDRSAPRPGARGAHRGARRIRARARADQRRDLAEPRHVGRVDHLAHGHPRAAHRARRTRPPAICRRGRRAGCLERVDVDAARSSISSSSRRSRQTISCPATASIVAHQVGRHATPAPSTSRPDAPASSTASPWPRLRGSAGIYRNVLVIGSRGAEPAGLDWEDRTTSVLFGDGAGAVLVSAHRERQHLQLRPGQRRLRGRVLGMPAGGIAMPASHHTVRDRRALHEDDRLRGVQVRHRAPSATRAKRCSATPGSRRRT